MKKSLKMLFFALLCVLTLLISLSAAPSAVAAPARVKALSADRIGANSVRLTWTAVKGVEGYVIYQRLASETDYQRVATRRDAAAYTVKGLKPNTSYTFAIRAYKIENGKEVRSPSYPTVKVKTMPEKVTDLKTGITANDTTKVILSWKASKGAEGYYVYYDVGGGWIKYTVTTATKLKIELPADTSSCRFGVKVYRTTGGKRVVSADLTSIKYTVPKRPGNVAGLKISSVGAKSLQLQWNPAKNADGYVICQKDDAGSYQRIMKKANSGFCTIEGLTANTAYRFAVRSYRTVGGTELLSTQYAELTAVTMALQVKNLSISMSELRSYSTWDASEGADGYMIYYNKGEGWVLYDTTADTFLRKDGLTAGTEYTFGVRTYKTVDGKRVVSSDITTVKSSTVPHVPNYTFTKKNNVYTLQWNKVRGADYYCVYSQAPGEEWVCRVKTMQQSASFTLKNTPKLYLAVRAVKKVGSKLYFGDYWKKLCVDKKPSGTVYTFGDSIANATGAHRYSYAELFAEKYNLSVLRAPISGSTLSTASVDRRHISEEIISHIRPGSSYSYIMIDGGCNDYYRNYEIGEVTSIGTKSFDTTTVCGALEASFTHIRKNSPDSRVIFVIMHNAKAQLTKTNDLGYTFNDYAVAIRAVCDKYGVAVADCLCSGLDTIDRTISGKYTNHAFGVYPYGDGVHATEAAYELFYLPVIEEAARDAQPIGTYPDPAVTPTEAPTAHATDPPTEAPTEPSADPPSEPDAPADPADPTGANDPTEPTSAAPTDEEVYDNE